MRHAWLRVGILAVLLAHACESSKGTKTDGSQEAAATCSGTCTGCCAGSECRWGNEDTACGMSGNPCVQCDPSYHCEDNRCVPESSACNSTNCSDGCCTPTGECQRPSNAEHCGLNGKACVTCIAEAQCTDGSCHGNCSESTCASGCCAATGACIQTPTDENCGKGGQACMKCNTATHTCQSGVCTPKTQPTECNASNCAGGCCDGTTCVLFAQQTDSKCGKDAANCAACNTATQMCQSGVCATKPQPDHCGTDNCAGGCCEGTTCRHFGAEQNAGKCGKNAGACGSCDDGNSCTDDFCTSSGDCGHSFKGVGASCTAGRCANNQQCCTSCLRDGNCQSTSADNCGTGGSDCFSCPQPSGQCKSRPSCVGWTCSDEGSLTGTSCSNELSVAGKCWNGTCCAGGCWNVAASRCESTIDDTKCGRYGAACQDCSDTETCIIDTGTCQACTPGGTWDPPSDKICCSQTPYNQCYCSNCSKYICLPRRTLCNEYCPTRTCP